MKTALWTALAVATVAAGASAIAATDAVSDSVISEQRANLAASTDGQGFGPQSPRDIDNISGDNTRLFATAPAYTEMNLCNIHMHEGAEHHGGEFTTYLGNGDGAGYGSGFGYNGKLSDAELSAHDMSVGDAGHGDLQPGDTIEVHYVHTTAKVTPGPTLGSCLAESIMNPQLRVETQVFVVVNDPNALDFVELTQVQQVEGLYQAVNLLNDTGSPVQYAGSTTGPSYNEAGSPLQVSWSVRPEVAKVNIHSIGVWFKDNQFDEKSAHAVRNLVTNPDLLSSK